MKDYNNLYCKIFIDTDLNKNNLKQMIINFKNKQANNQVCFAPQAYEFDLRNNNDFDREKRYKFPDGFLYYRFYLDVEPTTGTLQEICLNSIAHLLEFLWSKNYQAVAACDFEEILPRKGGYNRQAL